MSTKISDNVEQERHKATVYQIGSMPKAFTRISSICDLPSLVDYNALTADVARVSKLIMSELGYEPVEYPSFEVAASRVKRALIEFGSFAVPKQRLHAVQETASCELKSLLVSLSLFLNDELAFQMLNQTVVHDAMNKVALLPVAQEELSKRLSTDNDDVHQRILDALNSTST